MNDSATTLARLGPRAVGAPRPAAPAVIDLPPAPRTRWPTLVGIVVLVLLFGGFGAWSALAPLAEAAYAVGALKAEGNRRLVQHLEGGIVREILVRDGDRVRAGQTLVRLDDIQADAQLAALAAQRLALLAQDARLAAERAGAREIAWPGELLAASSDPRVADLLAGQTALFSARSIAFESGQAVLQARADQLRAQADAASGQIASMERQVALIREEMAAVAELLRLGLERRPRLLALQRAEASLIGNRADLAAQVAKAEAGVAETLAQLQAQRDARAADLSKEQREVRDRLVEVEERLRQARDIALRREIVAPVAGTVLNLRVFSPGQVVRPGEPVLEIVPEEERLVAEVMVLPTDIDSVRVGLSAEVRFPGVKQRLVPYLHGQVEFVSADATWDERLRTSVYRAHVSLDHAQVERIRGVTLVPGMPVEVMILVGERTFWQYITQPLRDSFVRAFREP
ncbi:MAG: HlyD family type I secretion periplasmic adaptor subunit [Elioraea sp.]|nr:HlyD family type I secretion periplasmic adaptor subunit [Elioraea sp.]